MHFLPDALSALSSGPSSPLVVIAMPRQSVHAPIRANLGICAISSYTEYWFNLP